MIFLAMEEEKKLHFIPETIKLGNRTECLMPFWSTVASPMIAVSLLQFLAYHFPGNHDGLWYV